MARLENWVLLGNHIYADIYDDEKGRFRDGNPIRTSTIQELNREEGYAQTRNTRYELGEKYVVNDVNKVEESED